MIEFTKSEKQELRRLAGDVYKAEMEKEVAKLEAAFKTWRDGKITVFDLDEQIHGYYSGPRKQLYSFYQMRNQPEAARRANATIVTDVFHTFNPHGISGIVVIAESHIAIHTWPEHGCASVDIFSCGNKMRPEVIDGFLKDVFKAVTSSCRELERGTVTCNAPKGAVLVRP